MPNKRKKFIDKKNAVTFQLVHRSQKDPLRADEAAPQHVLVEKHTGRVIPLNTESNVQSSIERRKEEQHKYGIYFDDDYNYLQHLKGVNVVGDWKAVEDSFRIPNEQQDGVDQKKQQGIHLPSSVFPSLVEEKEGLLNKAAPQSGPHPEWDPDIVAALDDDFDYDNKDNELEDDFVTLAKGSEDEESCSEEDDGSSDYSDDQFSFTEEEVRSRFTNYSMSSSVIPRAGGLQVLDERFEQMFEQYDDTELGSLDGEDIEGNLAPEVLGQLADEYSQRTMPTLAQVCSEPVAVHFNEEEETMELAEEAVQKEQWDCESILSTYSNLYNHPRLIAEPRKSLCLQDKVLLSSKTGRPAARLRQIDHECGSRVSTASSVRPKGESTEQRRDRKTQVKAERKERRLEKKANTMAFKSEKKRQEQVLLNLRNNLKSIKLM
ncbi:protein LTV1 homolog isoform X2 [Ornithodoros turicata]|uniref:protein LTV1 homolog isoform X2 n=1 Tax=Ornithodoros turicata TaxID=34597 RepID=UPI0031397B62